MPAREQRDAGPACRKPDPRRAALLSALGAAARPSRASGTTPDAAGRARVGLELGTLPASRACLPPRVTHPPRVRCSTPGAGPAPGLADTAGAGVGRNGPRVLGLAPGERGPNSRARRPRASLFLALLAGGREGGRGLRAGWVLTSDLRSQSGPDVESVTHRGFPACCLNFSSFFSPPHHTLHFRSSPWIPFHAEIPPIIMDLLHKAFMNPLWISSPCFGLLLLHVDHRPQGTESWGPRKGSDIPASSPASASAVG